MRWEVLSHQSARARENLVCNHHAKTMGEYLDLIFLYKTLDYLKSRFILIPVIYYKVASRWSNFFLKAV